MRLLNRIAPLAVFVALAGCEGRPSLFPNSDDALNKTSTQFAAEAAKRFPYPAAADRAGDAQGRATVDHMFAQLQVLNYSEEDWNNVDIWVNKSYVCHIPHISKAKEKVETLNFQMLYNKDGHFFDTNNGQNPMKEVELYRNGKLYHIPLALSD
jgi:hypothetical protein